MNEDREYERKTISSNTPWEAAVGYSRAVRVGNLVFVSGTTASDDDGNTVAVGNAYEQARYRLRRDCERPVRN